MQMFAGTSGFTYKEWTGPFYPADLKDTDRLSYYAAHLPAVEINNTFYRNPRSTVMERWAGQVPDGFLFVIKASRRITHHARLGDTDDVLGYLWSSISHLGPHLGPVLFQCPPYFRKDVPRLVGFLDRLPDGCRAVLEFRHPSWEDDAVYTALGDRGAALCFADKADESEPALQATSDWGYLRLRKSSYDESELDAWAERIRAQPWRQAFVFFKHEEEGVAPKLATALMERFGGDRET